MVKHLGLSIIMHFFNTFRFQHSLQRFSNAGVDVALVVISLVEFQIVCLCSLILTSIHCVPQSYRFIFPSDDKKLHRIPPHPGGNREIPKAWSITGGPVGAPTGPLHAL